VPTQGVPQVLTQNRQSVDGAHRRGARKNYWNAPKLNYQLIKLSVYLLLVIFTLSVSMVSIGEDSMISLGGHGENLMGYKYVHFRF
jgi:hypothetical protein